MSITFEVRNIHEHVDTSLVTYLVTCGFCHTDIESGVVYERGTTAYEREGYCEQCEETVPCYIGEQDATDHEPALNVSNRNAGIIVRAMQVEFDYCGSVDTGKVRLAAAMLDEEDTFPSVEHGNMISAGVSVEQVQRWCDALRRIADRADEFGEEVSWG